MGASTQKNGKGAVNIESQSILTDEKIFANAD